MATACEKGIFHGLKIPHSDITISHQFYADDALFMGEWKKSNIMNLARILRCFYISSGLKVNFQKSKVFGIGSSIQETSRWATPLGCEPACLPFTYLGVPIGANMNLQRHWQSIIERFHSKLTSWKAKTLSFGGRLTLIKSVLGNLSTYFFSIFVVPMGVINTLEKIRQKFLWGEMESNKKINWVAWEKVITHKDASGLGLGALRALNLSLITKWWWRYRKDFTGFWCQIIQGLHNLYDKPDTCIAKRTITVVWKSIASIDKN